MSAPPAIRPASEGEVPALAGALARAFFDDPVTGWAWKPDELRMAALERFQAIRLRQLLPHEEVWCSEDLSCAALWAPPGHWRASLRETIELMRCFLAPRLLVRMPLVALGWELLERGHPHEPHYYLAVLGTDPPAQGRGTASAVLGGVLEQCDRDGIGAFLESSKESNIAFYARHGFRVTEEVRLLRGPSMWKMWRDPRP